MSFNDLLRGALEKDILAVQSNLANAYRALGRDEQALCMRRDAYFGRLKLHGEEDKMTLLAANNYALSLASVELRRFAEAKSLLRKCIPVARRVMGEGNILTYKMRKIYARALLLDADATLEDFREAVETLEETARIARRVLGASHPMSAAIEDQLQQSRAALRVREGSVSLKNARAMLRAREPPGNA